MLISLSYKKTLSVASFVKSLRFISKDEAAETFSKDIGEDFVSFIGTNPLQNVIDLSLKADYANPIEWLKLNVN